MNKKYTNIDQLSLVVYDPPIDLPEQDRPGARILREGAASCSTFELLQVVIGGSPADAERIARQLLSECKDLMGIMHKSVVELSAITLGLGLKKSLHLKACMELGRRMIAQPPDTRLQIRTPADAGALLLPQMMGLEQEEVWTLMLDARSRVIGLAKIYKGNLSSATMRVCEVFREAIRHNAASIILAHNHPSTDPTPSSDDVFVTKELSKAGRLLDVELVDHLVIGHTYVSMKERGLGFE